MPVSKGSLRFKVSLLKNISNNNSLIIIFLTLISFFHTSADQHVYQDCQHEIFNTITLTKLTSQSQQMKGERTLQQKLSAKGEGQLPP